MKIEQKLFKLSAEITGVSAIITGLSNQLDSDETDVLTSDAMRDALFGISSYLGRIAGDLMNMEK